MDKIEELRQKELEVQKKQLFAQRVTAAASVANAVAAHKQAAATKEIQQQMAADAERNKLHQMLMAVQHEKMAEEQRLTNFRNIILTTLPLLKDEEEKKQYLTEQLLPKLKEEVAVPHLTPISVMSGIAGNTILESYLAYEAGQELKDFLSAGKKLNERTIEWNEKSKIQEKKSNELKEAQTKLSKIDKPFESSDVMAILGFLVLGRLVLWCLDSSATEQTEELFGGGLVVLIVAYFWQKRRRIKTLKAKIKSLGSLDDLPLKRERAELDEKSKFQTQNTDFIRSQIIGYLIGTQVFREIITGDPRSELLKIVTMFLEPCIVDLQSFLPPSSRLPASHFAQYFISDADVENFRKGQSTIENDLKSSLVLDYQNQTIILRNQGTV
jgi:hypothetical protein